MSSSSSTRLSTILFVGVASFLILQVYGQRNPFFSQQQNRQQQPLAQSNQPTQKPILKSSSQCPEPYGRFPTSQCDAYIECIDGQAEEKLCADGLLFNPAAGIHAFPCQYPIDVDCQGRTTLQPAQATEDCPHQYGYYKIGDSKNCGQFKNCVDGRAFVFDCPEGLAFDETKYRCDWADQVADCDAEAYLGFTCPPEPDARSGLGFSEYRYFRSPVDCSKYFVCVEGRPRAYSCGEDRAFNDLINACDGIENVTGCEPSPSVVAYQKSSNVKPVNLNQQQKQQSSFQTQRRG